jgi:hypothetical protein
MRVKNITQRFEAFVQNLQESFWGDFQGQTRQRLKEVLEKDAQQQMAEYLGLVSLILPRPSVFGSIGVTISPFRGCLSPDH